MAGVATDWAALFPDEDFSFRFGFRHGAPEEFFGPTPARSEVLDERGRWLDEDKARYCRVLPEGGGLLEATLRRAADWNALPEAPPAGTADQRCEWLGRHWEPDFLLLRPVNGEFVLCGGCVCFPSAWDLTDKLGSRLARIHETVPGLNDEPATAIDRYLTRLPTDRVALRSNWGLSRSFERNLHPAQQRSALFPPMTPDEVFLRIEKQALISLGKESGVLFGIRLEIVPLSEVLIHPAAARGLERALRTMPAAVARYKGLAASREALVAMIAAAGGGV